MSPKKNDPIQEVEVQTTSPPTTKSEQKPSYYSRQNEDLLTINDQERGVAPEDSDDVKWNYIAGAYLPAVGVCVAMILYVLIVFVTQQLHNLY